MKKMIAILTALLLALTVGCTAAVAEDDSVPPSTPEMKAYESFWLSPDGAARVWIGRQDDGFQIDAVLMTGNDTFTSWNYLSNFDKTTTSEDDVKATFTIDENGLLLWKEAKEGGLDVSLQRIGNFAGQYVYERALLTFVWNVHENDYSILLSWGQSAFQTWEYQLKGAYDPKTETVTFKGLKELLTYKDNGEIDTTAKVEESAVEGSCWFNDNGGLVWKCSDNDGEEIVFENELLALWEMEF